ncbi:TPA: hypothetical protein ACX3LL_004490 [Enterobacter asburiae]
MAGVFFNKLPLKFSSGALVSASAESNIEKIAELCQDKKHNKPSIEAAYGVCDVIKGGQKNGFSST